MPGFDGTGPKGQGPRTGWGRGKCSGVMSSLVDKTVTTIIIPTLGVIVNDIRKPDGVTRKLLASVKSHIAAKKLKNPDVRLISEKKDSIEKNE